MAAYNARDNMVIAPAYDAEGWGRLQHIGDLKQRTVIVRIEHTGSDTYAILGVPFFYKDPVTGERTDRFREVGFEEVQSIVVHDLAMGSITAAPTGLIAHPFRPATLWSLGLIDSGGGGQPFNEIGANGLTGFDPHPITGNPFVQVTLTLRGK